MNLRMKEWFQQPASFIYLNICFNINSRGKPKLTLIIFLLFPNLLLFIKLLWIHLSKDFFFWLTVYYSFISLERGTAGSLINGWKAASSRIKIIKNPLDIHEPFCFSISKTSTISLRASLKSDTPVSLGISAKGFLYPVMPRAEVHHWIMNRTQPAALESKGSWGMVEGEQGRQS